MSDFATASGQTPRPAGLTSDATFLPALEGLRGIAILLVFFHHASKAPSALDDIVRTLSPVDGELLDSALGPLHAFVVSGQTGVTLFFILSAYLLSRPFIAAHRNERVASATTFYRKRALRILPAYTVAVLFATWMTAASWAGMAGAVPYLAFAQGFTPLDPMMPYSAVWWSLATEVQFYLVLPWIALGLGHRSKLAHVLVAVGVLAWCVGYGWLMMLGHDEQALRIKSVLGTSLIGRAPAFMIGALCAWVEVTRGEQLRTRLRPSRFFGRGGGDLLVLILVVALGLLLREIARFNFFHAELAIPQWHLPESLLWGGIFFLLVATPTHSRRILSSRVLGLMGVLSYSLYLIHLPLLRLVIVPIGVELGIVPTNNQLSWPMMLIALVICTGVSAVTYWLIERPFLLLKERQGR